MNAKLFSRKYDEKNILNSNAIFKKLLSAFYMTNVGISMDPPPGVSPWGPGVLYVIWVVCTPWAKFSNNCT